ncbi:MAG: hypothetical protein CM15mP74_12430 [Halieaceae bacterium]|nr:MAG: hypothetical protein CM15mP74_12430 [Halieaceae bacterium]
MFGFASMRLTYSCPRRFIIPIALWKSSPSCVNQALYPGCARRKKSDHDTIRRYGSLNGSRPWSSPLSTAPIFPNGICGKQCARKSLNPRYPNEWLHADTLFHINPTGNFVIGGPQATVVSQGVKSSWIPMAAWPVRRRRFFWQRPIKGRSLRCLRRTLRCEEHSRSRTGTTM